MTTPDRDEWIEIVAKTVFAAENPHETWPGEPGDREMYHEDNLVLAIVDALLAHLVVPNPEQETPADA